MKKLKIDIVSDVVCPWCYLGQRRLSLALETLSDKVEADIHWKPFQLDPETPAEGHDAFEHLARKIGGPERVREGHAMLTRLGAAIDLPFAFEKAKIMPNTLDAHRLIRWAGELSADKQDEVVHALFTANFVEGRNIGDRSVLADIAEAAGMDRAAVEQKLASDEGKDDIRTEIVHAQRVGVTGVPFFIVNDKYAISGAQEVETFVNALSQIAEDA